MARYFAVLVSIQIFILTAVILAWQSLPMGSGHYLLQYDVARHALGKNHDHQRVVLIGGSSLAFSVSAERMSDELSVRVYNSGYNAGIGFGRHWDLLASSLDPKTDILVYSPEARFLKRPSEYSEVFCRYIFIAKNLLYLIKYPGCLGSLMRSTGPGYKRLYKTGRAFPEEAIYTVNSFDEFGDLVAHLDPPEATKPFKARGFPPPSFEEINSFLVHVAKLKSQGFEVYFIPTMLDARSCINWDERKNFLERLNRSVNGDAADAITITPDRVCRPQADFFDTSYHMNANGRAKRTTVFIEELRALLDRNEQD